MKNGFTLIELIVTLVLLISLVVLASPSIISYQQNNETKRLASDLFGFLTEAKTQSVMLNQPLKLEFHPKSSRYGKHSNWSISLTKRDNGQLVSYLNSEEYPNHHIDFSTNNITYQGVNGKPTRAFNIQFYLDKSRPLKVIVHHITGRVRTCSLMGDDYGYKQC